MKRKVFLLLGFLLFYAVSFTQKGGRPPSRPATERPVYERSERYEKKFERNGIGSGNNSYYYSDFSASKVYAEIDALIPRSEKNSIDEHISRWKYIKEIAKYKGVSEFDDYPVYEVAFQNNSFQVLHCGEDATKDFIITKKESTIEIKISEKAKGKKIELVFDEFFWRRFKKVHAEGLQMKTLGKNGKVYEIEIVQLENKRVYYFGVLKEGLWFDPKNADVDKMLSNLEREFNPNSIRVFSVISDSKTNEYLKSYLPSQSATIRNKNILLKRIKALEKGSTIFIIGHHENGRFVSHDESGQFVFELSAAELKQIGKERSINIFPLGCKTAFSNFKEGADVNLNSLELIKALLSNLGYSTNFGEVLEKIISSNIGMKILLNENSFSFFTEKVEIETKTEDKFMLYYQEDSTEIKKRIIKNSLPPDFLQVGGGLICVIPQKDTSSAALKEIRLDDLLGQPRYLDSNSSSSITSSSYKKEGRSNFRKFLECLFYSFIIIFIVTITTSKEENISESFWGKIVGSFAIALFFSIFAFLVKLIFPTE